MDWLISWVTRWDAQFSIPLWLVDTLHLYHTQCHLYTRVVRREDSARTLTYLRDSPILVSLVTYIGTSQLRSFLEMQRTASSCHNLEGLSITLIPEAPAYAFSAPHLLVSRDRPLVLKALDIDGMQLDLSTDSYWATFVEWSGLRRLSVPDLSFLPNLASSLTGLRSLRIQLSSDIGLPMNIEAFHNFLYMCNKLKELDLTGFTEMFNATLFCHLGKTLESLRLHEYEKFEGVCKRSVLSRADLVTLGQSCPKLRKFALDLAYDSDWVNSVLEVLEIWVSLRTEQNLAYRDTLYNCRVLLVPRTLRAQP